MLSGKVSTDINVAIVPFILHIFIKKKISGRNDRTRN